MNSARSWGASFQLVGASSAKTGVGASLVCSRGSEETCVAGGQVSKLERSGRRGLGWLGGRGWGPPGREFPVL